MLIILKVICCLISHYASLGLLLRISKKTACQLFQPLKYKAVVESKVLYDEPLKQLERKKVEKISFSTFFIFLLNSTTCMSKHSINFSGI
ncbi:Uncharacterised protein [Bartonella grahamii]|uniref:Uncharacterized protein n=1 Tax=Bartonella grahamii TaxID=33045 RepID=A0A336NA01_BARGR|nr:Uncharacterised protein [Bartonella grahamii]